MSLVLFSSGLWNSVVEKLRIKIKQFEFLTVPCLYIIITTIFCYLIIMCSNTIREAGITDGQGGAKQ